MCERRFCSTLKLAVERTLSLKKEHKAPESSHCPSRLFSLLITLVPLQSVRSQLSKLRPPETFLLVVARASFQRWGPHARRTLRFYTVVASPRLSISKFLFLGYLRVGSQCTRYIICSNPAAGLACPTSSSPFAGGGTATRPKPRPHSHAQSQRLYRVIMSERATDFETERLTTWYIC